MNENNRRSIKIYVEGKWALWTRPEMKVERVSYEVPTFSAMRGLLQAIYWKPSVAWDIQKIRVLRPSQFISVKRNELLSSVVGRGDKDNFYIEENRTQRYSLMLQGVPIEQANERQAKLAYILEADLVLTPLAGKPISNNRVYSAEELANDANIKKHECIVHDRLTRGRAFMQPVFGSRECPAFFRLANDNDLCLLGEKERGKDLGYMFYDFDFSNPKQPLPLFFRASIDENGYIIKPKAEDIKR